MNHTGLVTRTSSQNLLSGLDQQLMAPGRKVWRVSVHVEIYVVPPRVKRIPPPDRSAFADSNSSASGECPWTSRPLNALPLPLGGRQLEPFSWWTPLHVPNAVVRLASRWPTGANPSPRVRHYRRGGPAVRTGFYLLAAAAFVSSLSLLVLRYRTLEAEEREWSAGQASSELQEVRSEQTDAERDSNNTAESAAAEGLKGVRPLPRRVRSPSSPVLRWSSLDFEHRWVPHVGTPC
eukprot:1195455-Prorocentrum_minimum.AAC.4